MIWCDNQPAIQSPFIFSIGYYLTVCIGELLYQLAWWCGSTGQGLLLTYYILAGVDRVRARTKQQMTVLFHWSTTDTIFNKSKVIYVTVAGQGYFNRNVIEKRPHSPPPHIIPQPARWWRHFALRTDDGVTEARSIINQSLHHDTTTSLLPMSLRINVGRTFITFLQMWPILYQVLE